MKRIIIILCVLWSACSIAQPPTVLGYQTINNKFVYLGIGASALNVPAGGSAAFATSQWVRSGALYYDSTGTDTGLYVSHGTKWVKVGGSTDANTGLILAAGGISQMGQPRGTSGDPALISSRREIPTLVDSVFAGIKLKQQGLQNSVELAGYGFIQLHRSDGSAINMSFGNGAGAASTSISYYKGLNPIGAGTSPTLEVATGVHWSGAGIGGHYYTDMRDSTMYTSIEVAGVSHTNFVSTSFGGGGITQLGILGKVGVGPAVAHTSFKGYFYNQKSEYITDSLMYEKKMFRTDTTGGDLMMVSRATPYEVKVITTADFKTAVGITSGVYTPTLTSVTNVGSSSVTTNAFHYQRVGNEVSVSGTFTVTPTAGTSLTQIAFSLPIASNLAASIDAGGVSAGTGASHFSGDFTGDSTNDRIQIDFVSTNTSAHTIYISGHYIIK